MTRLQKKCLIAVAGTHLLVIVAVFCSGFIRPTPTPDNSTLLTVIPTSAVDAALNSGVKSAPTPPATPIVPPALPPPPTPVATPPPPVTPPAPVPKPTIMERVKEMFTPEKPPVDDTKPADEPKPKKVHKIEPNLKPTVRTASKTTDTSAADEAKEAKRQRDLKRKMAAEVARAIKDNSSSATTVVMPGDNSVSFANYASIVKSIYEQTWVAPDNTASDDANTKVSVTIASDGHVISARIIKPSGDASVDASVQRTLDRVTSIAPFPDGATEKERTFIINFNLQAKRLLG